MKKIIYFGYIYVGLLSLYIIINCLNLPFSYSAGNIDSDIVETGQSTIERKTILKQKDNILYVSFDELNEFMNDMNNYINYDKELKTIYEDIINKYFKSKRIKMYNEGNNTIIEINYSRDEAINIFNSYIKDYDNLLIKILFDNNKKAQELDLDALNLKINREQVIREGIVKLAQSQLGKTGEDYWTWYGYNHRVEWCCVFVSWLAYKNGVLYSHIPKFIWVKKGVDYYRDKGELKFPKNYTPKPGDIIFFNWNNNPVIDHVGIVEKVQNGYVYSIEGNVQYKWVKRRRLKATSRFIYAYGVPDYSK